MIPDKVYAFSRHQPTGATGALRGRERVCDHASLRALRPGISSARTYQIERQALGGGATRCLGHSERHLAKAWPHYAPLPQFGQYRRRLLEIQASKERVARRFAPAEMCRCRMTWTLETVAGNMVQALRLQEDTVMNTDNAIAPLILICVSLVVAVAFSGMLGF